MGNSNQYILILQIEQRIEKAKAKEKEQREKRIKAEEQLIALIEDQPEEGTCHIGRSDVKFGMTRKINLVGLGQVWHMIPDDVKSKVFPEKPFLNLAEFRKLEGERPDIFSIVAPYVIAKPSKPSVKVKQKEEGEG